MAELNEQENEVKTSILEEIKGLNSEKIADIILKERSEKERAEKEARVDSLTGLPNRRGFEEYAQVAFAHSLRSKEPISRAVVDVDDFKVFNNTYGHSVGDRVLVAISQALQAGTRQEDILGRTGGDELEIIFPNTDQDQAQHVADRLQNTLREILDNPGDWGIPKDVMVSISVGIAQYEKGLETFEQTKSRADKKMYTVKKGKKK
jgi:diguanylate cyclase (GGDEF)-like protein